MTCFDSVHYLNKDHTADSDAAWNCNLRAGNATFKLISWSAQ